MAIFISFLENKEINIEPLMIYSKNYKFFEIVISFLENKRIVTTSHKVHAIFLW